MMDTNITAFWPTVSCPCSGCAASSCWRACASCRILARTPSRASRKRIGQRSAHSYRTPSSLLQKADPWSRNLQPETSLATFDTSPISLSLLPPHTKFFWKWAPCWATREGTSVELSPLSSRSPAESPQTAKFLFSPQAQPLLVGRSWWARGSSRTYWSSISQGRSGWFILGPHQKRRCRSQQSRGGGSALSTHRACPAAAMRGFFGVLLCVFVWGSERGHWPSSRGSCMQKVWIIS